MADKEPLRILKEEGVEALNKWRNNLSEKNPGTGIKIDLSRASLRGFNLCGASLCGADLSFADLSRANLSFADLSVANLIGANLTGADLTNANLSFAKLSVANLTNANLTSAKLGVATLEGTYLDSAKLTGVQLTLADLSFAKLNLADLREADLTEAILNGANFNGANLGRVTITGAIIEGWSINNQTALYDVDCDYIYLKVGKKERRPVSGNFASGEFAKTFKQSKETLDLIFKNGIDWQAYLLSFRELQKKYGKENIFIQAIEKDSDDALIIRLSVSSDMNKEHIERYAEKSYKKHLKIIEDKYRAELQIKDKEIKDKEINLYKQFSADIFEIVKLQASRSITFEAKAVAESKSQEDSIKFENSNVGVGVNKDSAIANVSQVGGTTDKKQSESTTKAIKKIEQLLQELSQENPPKKESEKVAMGEEVIERIENDPTWKQRVINAAKEGGLAAFEKALDSTAGTFITGVIKGWLEAEA